MQDRDRGRRQPCRVRSGTETRKGRQAYPSDADDSLDQSFEAGPVFPFAESAISSPIRLAAGNPGRAQGNADVVEYEFLAEGRVQGYCRRDKEVNARAGMHDDGKPRRAAASIRLRHD